MSLTAAVALSESPVEALLASALHAVGFELAQPNPWRMEVQYEVSVEGAAYRFDFAFILGSHRVGVEVDGEDLHSAPAQVRRDKDRDWSLQRGGWRVLRMPGAVVWRDPIGAAKRIQQTLETLAATVVPADGDELHNRIAAAEERGDWEETQALLRAVQERAARRLAGR